MNDPHDMQRRVSEADMRRVLTRAAEIDVDRKASFTPNEIVAAAAEAGISEASVRSAMGEVLGGAEPAVEQPAAPAAAPWWKRRFQAALLGAGLGAFAGLFRLEYGTNVDFGPALGLAGLVIASIRYAVRSRSQVEFHGANVALWACFAAAYAGFGPREMQVEAIGALTLYWAASAALGSVINFFETKVGRRRRPAEPDATGGLHTA